MRPGGLRGDRREDAPEFLRRLAMEQQAVAHPGHSEPIVWQAALHPTQGAGGEATERGSAYTAPGDYVERLLEKARYEALRRCLRGAR